MHDSGMSNEEISSITGHKNPKSVQHYIRKNEQKIMHASDVLSNIFHESSVEKSEASIEIKNKETIMAKVSRSAVRGCSISSRDDEDEPATKVINIYNPSNCAFNFWFTVIIKLVCSYLNLIYNGYLNKLDTAFLNTIRLLGKQYASVGKQWPLFSV